MSSHRGRPRATDRIFEHHCHSIDATHFKKMRGFKPEIRYEFLPDVPEPLLNLSVSLRWNNGSTTSVMLVTTRPNFGGSRYWLKCPHCGRRVRKLYPEADSHCMACRKCFGLVYDSQYLKGERYAMLRLLRKWFSQSTSSRP